MAVLVKSWRHTVAFGMNGRRVSAAASPLSRCGACCDGRRIRMRSHCGWEPRLRSRVCCISHSSCCRFSANRRKNALRADGGEPAAGHQCHARLGRRTRETTWPAATARRPRTPRPRIGPPPRRTRVAAPRRGRRSAPASRARVLHHGSTQQTAAAARRGRLDPAQIRPIVASGKFVLKLWINEFGVGHGRRRSKNAIAGVFGAARSRRSRACAFRRASATDSRCVR